MYKQETIKPYSKRGDKASQVEAMFDNIAPTYDKLNHQLSWDIDRYWRNKAIRRMATHEPKRILDIATGTGDFAILAAEKLRPRQVIGADISEGMMEIGRAKVKERGLQDVISFKKEDCTCLSFGEGQFDAVMAAFGIRNFQDLEKGLREMQRAYHARGIPYETAISHIQPHHTAYIWPLYQQGHSGLLVPYKDYRGLSARGDNGGDIQESRVQQGYLHAIDIRDMHPLHSIQMTKYSKL